jgi:hypothetical protein
MAPVSSSSWCWLYSKETSKPSGVAEVTVTHWHFRRLEVLISTWERGHLRGVIFNCTTVYGAGSVKQGAFEVAKSLLGGICGHLGPARIAPQKE